MWQDVLTEGSDGVFLDLDVTPGSRSTGLKGYDQWRKRIKISIKTEARDGKANAALISYLASLFDVPGNNITITSGQTSGQKRVLVSGIELSSVIKKLEASLGPG